MKMRISLSGEQLDAGLEGFWQSFEGVGMIRSEYLLRQIGSYWSDPATCAFVEEYVDTIAAAFAPRPVWYRAADLWSNEANPLQRIDEIRQEENPMIGLRGARRALTLPIAFEREIGVVAGVARVRPNLHLLLSFVGDAGEFSSAVDLANRAGWQNRVGSMIEIPSAVLDVDRFIAAGASNLMIGLNDLTCLLLGTARSSGFDLKEHRAVWWCVDYVKERAGSRLEWGIAGSLQSDILVRAREAGVPYASLHYSQLPQLLDIDPATLHDLSVVKRVRELTRARAREFNAHR